MNKSINDVPISSFREAGDYVFLAGHGPRDIHTGKVFRSDIEYQTKKTLENILQTLRELHLSLSDIVSVTTYLRNIEDFEKYNEIYKKIIGKPYPVRTTIVAGLVASDINIEITVIAYKRKK